MRPDRALLTWAVRGRDERGSEFGEAMLRELDEVDGRLARLRWAASGAWVARRDRLRRRPESGLLGRWPEHWRITARVGYRLALAGIAVALVNQFVLTVRYEASASMTPAVGVGERFLVDRLAFRLTGLSYGQVVLFTAHPGGPAVELAKRVVGVAGDTLSCVDGRLMRNGVAADEPYLPDGVVTECAPVIVAPGTVYVLGDNRADSVDSRQLGPVRTADVLGRAILT